VYTLSPDAAICESTWSPWLISSGTGLVKDASCAKAYCCENDNGVATVAAIIRLADNSIICNNGSALDIRPNFTIIIFYNFAILSFIH
jgi:hypothetical protein